MFSLDTLYFSLAIGFLALSGFTCYVLYELAQDLKAFRRILLNVDNITNMDLIGNKIKYSIFSLINTFLNKKKGGGTNGSKKR